MLSGDFLYDEVHQDSLQSRTVDELNAADFNQLSEAEKRHFYKCEQCGEMVDMRQLDDVLFHEITYTGQTFNTAGQRNFDLFPHTFDRPTFRRLWGQHRFLVL